MYKLEKGGGNRNRCNSKGINKYYTIPHNAEIFRKYWRNIPWKYCKNIAKIFRNLSLILLKYFNNLKQCFF